MLRLALAAIAAFFGYTIFRASIAVPDLLSPQGCRMSYMSPSYILQAQFDLSWTALASRYSLWLYREVGWDSAQPLGTPVLFIPGNAGSSHQVRSIASSAARQYLQSPEHISPEFASRGILPLDVYAVEFNEDLSAFHGPTLLAQRSYVLNAMRYINTLYPPSTKILILGHSMGGVVATSLLPSENISAIVTMATPHTIPPARFDRRIEEIFRENQLRLKNDPTPIVSLCGGAADLMIPSESCVLPVPSADVYRSTLFTSALEGSWTGVGHQVIVWCHQVRWQIARAALELSAALNVEERSALLSRWLRGSYPLPLDSSPNLQTTPDSVDPSQKLEIHHNLTLPSPKFAGSRTFYMPYSGTRTFVLYVSQGSIRSVSPHHPNNLHVEIFICRDLSSGCEMLKSSVLRLLPSSQLDQKFPVPRAGTDESQGIVLFEAELPSSQAGESWVAVKVDGTDGRGWISGGFFNPDDVGVSELRTIDLIFSKLPLSLRGSDGANFPVKTSISFPHLLSNVLAVYRLTPHFPTETCQNNLLPPLLLHDSSSEAHYHRLLPLSATHHKHVLLHTHSSAPYIHAGNRKGVNLTIYTSGESNGCFPDELEISIDWWSTLGRWGTRYWPAVATWSVGLICLLIWNDLDTMESGGGNIRSVSRSLSRLNHKLLPRLLLGSFIISFIPLPADVWLGNAGEPVFSPLAPLLVIVCTGLVNVSWLLLDTSITMSRYFMEKISDVSRDRMMKPRKFKITIASIGFVFILIFLLVPWQVAFLGCWIIHYWTCVTSSQRVKPSPSTSSASLPMKDYSLENHNVCTHMLLLMTWLLPLTAPVLGVWARTMATAGFTTPFDGDHNFLYVAPFLFYVDWSWTCVRKLGRVKPFQKSSIEKISSKWLIAIAALVAFLYGPRYNFLIFDFVSCSMGALFVLRVGSRFWQADK